MSIGKKIKEWAVDNPFHVIRYTAAIIFLFLTLSRYQQTKGAESAAGSAMLILMFLLFLILFLACIIPDVIALITGKMSGLLTQAVMPNERADKMLNDPRLPDFYLKEERYEEALHEYGRLLDDYPKDYHITSQMVKIYEIQGDEENLKDASERLSKLPIPVPEPEVLEEDEESSTEEVSAVVEAVKTEVQGGELDVEQVDETEPKPIDTSFHSPAHAINKIKIIPPVKSTPKDASE